MSDYAVLGTIQPIPKDKTPYCRTCGAEAETFKLGSATEIARIEPCGCGVEMPLSHFTASGDPVYTYPEIKRAVEWR